MKNRLILQGDVSEKIKNIPGKSIDLICTDPPYGYSFMNKDWDKAADEMLDSKWAKNDSPARAKRTAQMMRTGSIEK